MKVFLNPIGLHSRAMVRIAKALDTFKPESVETVPEPSQAELIIFYAIGGDQIERCRLAIEANQDYAIVQCCVKTAGVYSTPESETEWKSVWNDARCKAVWSYLTVDCNPAKFYYAPLGIDESFLISSPEVHARLPKQDYVVTTGYVSGYPAEPIVDVWQAMASIGMKVRHIGGWPSSAKRSDFPLVMQMEGITDNALRWFFSRARATFALRWVEGFEMPAVESLCCGTRPIVFDQADMRHWYGDHAVFVSESSDLPMIDRLETAFSVARANSPKAHEIRLARERFSWETIARGFWAKLAAGM